MSDHDQHSFAHHIRRYIWVFVALLIGTVFTVWAASIHFGSREINIAIALAIASCKAFLVAGYFMHLVSERKMIYSILAFTAFFFVGLMFLTLWSMGDMPPLTIKH